MTHLVQAVAGALIAGLLLLTGGVLTAMWVARRLRRRSRSARRLLADLCVSAGALAGRRMLRHVAGQPWTTARWWQAQYTRRQLWRAVHAARHAVTEAASAGAPVGDLPALVAQLQRLAEQADTSLRLRANAPAGRVHGDPDSVSAALAAAARIHASAADALAATSEALASGLTRDSQQEGAALAAGLARLRQLGSSQS